MCHQTPFSKQLQLFPLAELAVAVPDATRDCLLTDLLG